MNLFKESGRVKKIVGPLIEGTLPGASIGGLCGIVGNNGSMVSAEIVGFRDRTAILMPFQHVEGLSMGSRIEHLTSRSTVSVSPELLGTLVNGYGDVVEKLSDEPLSVSGMIQQREIKGAALLPSQRRPISERFETGIRAIDATLPLGLGQRISVMAASGVGKSILMSMMAQYCKSDVTVIALIGERGREVTEFIEKELDSEAKKRTIVVAVTSDESPVLRVRGAYVATSIAEYFRDQGLNVLLMMDSVTRFGMALREIGLASGEPPTTKGYTPSVFSQLPRLLERAGAKRGGGSITGVYTVLVEGNDLDDPIADHVRSIVDGHIVLSRDLAEKNHYPAIDVLASISRVNHVVSKERERALNSKIRQTLSIYKEAEDLINIGAYRKGNNPGWDKAIQLYPKVIDFLKQEIKESSNLNTTLQKLEEIYRE